MNTKQIAASVLGISGGLSAAFGQAFSGGILHTPLGIDGGMEVTERRLRYCCLGSSGQDGVEVQLRSLWGGGAGVDLSGLSSTNGEIKIRIRGWDGTIKGTLRSTGNGDGTISNEVDFSGLGATGCIERQFDEFGFLIAEIYTPGPIWAGPTVPDCTPPLVPTVWWTSWGQWVWGCGYGNNLYGDPYPYTQRTVSPDLPIGVIADLSAEALLVTGNGGGGGGGGEGGELFVIDASLGTFGVSSWGLGAVMLGEQCADPIACDRETVALVATNISGPGQDGLIGLHTDLGDHAGSAELARPGGTCCRGHVIIMKAYDDDGQELSRVISSEDPATGEEVLSFDFSGVGANAYQIVMENSAGQEVGSEDQVNGGGGIRPLLSGLCPPGSREWWIQNDDFSWTFVGCLTVFDMVVPGGGTYADVARVHIRPIDAPPTQRRLRSFETTATNMETITLFDVNVRPPCPGDISMDGVVDLLDLTLGLSAFGSHFGDAGYSSGADMDKDGLIGLSDLTGWLSAFGTVCY